MYDTPVLLNVRSIVPEAFRRITKASWLLDVEANCQVLPQAVAYRRLYSHCVGNVGCRVKLSGKHAIAIKRQIERAAGKQSRCCNRTIAHTRDDNRSVRCDRDPVCDLGTRAKINQPMTIHIKRRIDRAVGEVSTDYHLIAVRGTRSASDHDRAVSLQRDSLA